MRRYAYVGPSAVREANKNAPHGLAIESADDLRPHAAGEPLTFVVDAGGTLRVATRRSEHVACAGGGEVLSAGELTAVVERGVVRVVEVSNLSPGTARSPNRGAQSRVRSIARGSSTHRPSRSKRSSAAARRAASATSSKTTGSTAPSATRRSRSAGTSERHRAIVRRNVPAATNAKSAATLPRLGSPPRSARSCSAGTKRSLSRRALARSCGSSLGAAPQSAQGVNAPSFSCPQRTHTASVMRNTYHARHGHSRFRRCNENISALNDRP